MARLVGGFLGAERLLLGGGAELLDDHLGMGLLDRGDGGERRLGLLGELVGGRVVLDARQLEVHDDRAAVLGDRVRLVPRVERALDLGDAVDPLEALYDVRDGGGDLRITALDRALALDEDLLARGVREVGGVHQHLGALRLAVAHLGGRQLLLADLRAADGGDHDEEYPAEDGDLAVLRAPSAGAPGEVSRVHARDCPSQPGARPTGLQASASAGRSAPVVRNRALRRSATHRRRCGQY